jgi:hypothetical protein
MFLLYNYTTPIQVNDVPFGRFGKGMRFFRRVLICSAVQLQNKVYELIWTGGDKSII